MTHTPIPWQLSTSPPMQANRIWSQDMRPIAGLLAFGMGPADIDPTAQANAAFIVRACNAHDELVAALCKLTTLAANVCTATDGIAVINAVATLRPAIPEMRAVLAKVQ